MGSTRRGHMKRPCEGLSQHQEEYWQPLSLLTAALNPCSVWNKILLLWTKALLPYHCHPTNITPFLSPQQTVWKSCSVVIWGYCMWVLPTCKFNIYPMTYRGMAWTIRSSEEDPALVSPPSPQVSYYGQQYLAAFPFVSKQLCRKEL